MIVVCIPTRDRADLCYDLCKRLIAEQGVQVIVADNGAPRAPMIDIEHLGFDTGRVRVLHARAAEYKGRIYRLWNWSWDAAMALAPADEHVEVAFVNDDARPSPAGLGCLAYWLRRLPDAGIVYPDYMRPPTPDFDPFTVHPTATWGTVRNGGMSGSCFMVRGELGLRFDESYEWWYGDDDFAEQVRRVGLRQYRVNGVGLEHENEATARLHAWTDDAKVRDLARYTDKWRRP